MANRSAVKPSYPSYLFKILLLGDSGVGKTSLDTQFHWQYFPVSTCTLGVGFKCRDVDVDGSIIRLQVWDTSGQERFQSLGTAFFRGADGVMFVFDLTSKDTLENIAHWRHELAVNTTNAIPAVLVGNKSDLPSREVSAMEAQQLATSLTIPYIETSAKLNTNVDLAFVSAARRIVAAVDACWTRQLHAELPRHTRAWIENVLFCAHRIGRLTEVGPASGETLAPQPDSNTFWPWLMKWVSPSSSKKKYVVAIHDPPLPRLPPEMWFGILSLVRVGRFFPSWQE
eukprot:m.16007 g.16007  ORF g.16007 m.16007 type:complete len:284 (+) comp4996_c0_seq1:234-1085(+)